MADDHYIDALPPGYRLREYEILRVLGRGGFGITYLAHDTLLDRHVAVKEYLPTDYAARTENHSVRPKSSGTSKDYTWGLDRFLDEARTLARLEHPSIVRVHAYVELNGTGYIVMEYIKGESLDDRLKRQGELDPFDFKFGLTAILKPLVGGLEQVHSEGYLHRDITPRNIMLKEDGTPVLIDFGSARQMVAARSRNVTALVTPCYAPLEQYSPHGKQQGPWTDIYALSAVAYRCITGNVPIDATERVQGDELMLASEIGQGRCPAGLLTAVDQGLSLKREERPQDLKAWREAWCKPSAGAADWYRRAAEQGRPSAQWYLGDMHATGRWVAQNDVEAVKWFLTAAERGHILAQTHLCGMYSRGRGVAQDDVEALKWCLLATNQGDAFAQCAVGVMCEKGRGIAQDDAEAVRWYRRAAEQGYGRAQFYLGVMYLEGRGLRCTPDSDNDEDRTTSDVEKEQDWEEASRLFELAAERGVASAKWYRGCMTHMLAYVNDENARMWRQKAALEGDPAAQYVLGVKEQEDQWEEGPYYPEGLHCPEGWYWMATENKALHRLPVSSSDSGWLFDVIDVMYAEGRWKQEDDDAYGLQSYWMAKEQGNSLVQYELGVMYEEGLHTFHQDDAKAVEWHRRAAEQGNADAQHALAEMYSKGRGVTQIMATAVDYYRLAASQGHTEAQFSLGLIYHDPMNRQVPVWWEDQEEAMKWFRMAGEQGHLASQSILREAYHEGRFVPEDDKEAIKWALLAAKQGDEAAQYFLGVMHAEGRGVTRDDGEAVRWYRRAAEQGNGEAQYALGFMYAEARGVAQDDAEAVKWYRLAADQDPYVGIGDALARYALGFMYAEGRGVAQNNAEAVKWFRLSAKEGYGYSWSVPDGSDAQATEQYRLAAELGDAQAQFSLGFLYGEGRGVAQDDAEAVKWYRLAAKQWPPSRNIPTV